MSEFTIYHNPRCSKSRQTLALLTDAGVEPTIVLYLDDVPSKAQLKDVLSKLEMTPRALLRKGEAAYKVHNLADQSLTDSALIDAMIASPKLIERPIVIKGAKAVLGRPPENVNTLL